MFDIGVSELGVIGAVALVVLGPERLPRVARTVGNLLGRAQRYLAEVKAEVNRQIDLDELRSMKSGVEQSVRDMQASVAENVGQLNDEFESAWRDATAGLHGAVGGAVHDAGTDSPQQPYLAASAQARRIKRPAQAVPIWYRRQVRVRRHALSGAARSARAGRARA